MKYGTMAFILGTAALSALVPLRAGCAGAELRASSGEEASAEVRVQEDQAHAQQEADRARAEAERALREAEAQRDLAREAQARAQRIMATLSSRPLLGIILQTDRDPDTDAVGALIEAVTPGGPADQAGLRAEDIIVSFNGKKLAGPNPEADADESAPAARLLSLARALKDGDKVAIEYRRGKAAKTATLTARALDDGHMRIFVDKNVAGIPDLSDLRIPDIPENFIIDIQARGMDMDLVSLNPDLGEYFGTSAGLLVVRAPKDSPFKLKGGDVLLKIGDRTPATPTQAFRILDSYEPGETIRLEVLRMHQKTDLNVTVPQEASERKQFKWRMKTPEAPATPAPPAAPLPPKVPAPVPAPSGS